MKVTLQIGLGFLICGTILFALTVRGLLRRKSQAAQKGKAPDKDLTLTEDSFGHSHKLSEGFLISSVMMVAGALFIVFTFRP